MRGDTAHHHRRVGLDLIIQFQSNNGGKNGGGGVLQKFELQSPWEPWASSPKVPARFDFFRQGATVSAGPTTIAGGASADISIYDTGAIQPGDVVQLGFAGQVLSVTAITLPDVVTLHNATGSAITVNLGVRLIDTSDRPTAYLDALAVTAIGSAIQADSGGRAVAYLPPAKYDVLVVGNPPVFDAAQSYLLTAASSTASWYHTASGSDRAVFVAVSWQEGTGTESITGVTYAGQAMTRVASTALVDLFTLASPPTGSSQVVVTWSGAAAKGAVCGSVSFTSVNQPIPVGTAATASAGSTPSTHPTVNLTPVHVDGAIVGVVGVNSITSVTGITTLAGTERWNNQAGTSGAATRTQGASTTMLEGGSPVTVDWSLAAAKLWGVAAAEVLPAQNRLYADQEGVCGCDEELGVNAAHFDSLQQAIDALPDTGGVVNIPAGTYRLWDGLTITKPNVTLIGEGANTIITPFDPDEHPIDLLTIMAAEARLYRLKFDGAASAIDLTGGTCGVVCLGQDATAPERLVQHCYLENVVVTGNSRSGLRLADTILMTAINCEFVANKGDGVRIQGAEAGGSSTTLRFVGCAMSGNGGIGVNIGDPSGTPTGQVSQTFLGCTIQGNQGASAGGVLANIGVGVTAVNSFKLEFLSCYLEVPPTGTAQYMLFDLCPSVTVDSCVFFGNLTDHTMGPDRAVNFKGCYFARLSSNVMQGFKTEIAKFDTLCEDVFETCNRDLNATTVPRITVLGRRVMGTSQKSIVLPRFESDATRPSAGTVRPGSMIWVEAPTSPNTNLQISDGTTWVQI